MRMMKRGLEMDNKTGGVGGRGNYPFGGGRYLPVNIDGEKIVQTFSDAIQRLNQPPFSVYGSDFREGALWGLKYMLFGEEPYANGHTGGGSGGPLRFQQSQL